MATKSRQDPDDPKSKIVVHGDGCGPGNEFTACAQAFEEWDASEVEVVESAITCDDCIAEIEQWHRQFYKVKGKWFQNVAL